MKRINSSYSSSLVEEVAPTGRRLGDRFREHLRDVEKDDKDASKPVARHFNLPNHSKQHMAVCGLSLCSHITVFISKLTPTSISGQIVRFTSTSELIRRFARIKIYKE